MHKIYYWHHTVFQFQSNIRQNRYFVFSFRPASHSLTHSSRHDSSRLGAYLVYDLEIIWILSAGRFLYIQYFIYIFSNHSFRTRTYFLCADTRTQSMHSAQNLFMCVYIECRAYRGHEWRQRRRRRPRRWQWYENIYLCNIFLLLLRRLSIVRLVDSHSTPPFSIHRCWGYAHKNACLVSARKVDIWSQFGLFSVDAAAHHTHTIYINAEEIAITLHYHLHHRWAVRNGKPAKTGLYARGAEVEGTSTSATITHLWVVSVVILRACVHVQCACIVCSPFYCPVEHNSFRFIVFWAVRGVASIFFP